MEEGAWDNNEKKLNIIECKNLNSKENVTKKKGEKKGQLRGGEAESETCRTMIKSSIKEKKHKKESKKKVMLLEDSSFSLCLYHCDNVKIKPSLLARKGEHSNDQ